MKIGVLGNVLIVSATKREYNDKQYFSLCLIGADGFADNLNCDEAIYNKVMAADFVKPCMYEVNFEYSQGNSSKGRYSYLRAVSIGKKVG